MQYYASTAQLTMLTIQFLRSLLVCFLFLKFSFGFVGVKNYHYREYSRFTSKSFRLLSCVVPNEEIRQKFAPLIEPPGDLISVALGESINPIPDTPLSITRVSNNPDIFIFRNFLPLEQDRKALIEESLAGDGLQNAETKSGLVCHRKNSSLAWIDIFNIDDNPTFGRELARFMVGLTLQLFCSEDAPVLGALDPEVQVAKYTSGGKFDLHHDGYGRPVTILTYLNGIAGTWFPFAALDGDGDGNDVPPEMTLESVGMVDDKHPGKNGLLVVGKESELEEGPHVVRIQSGDSVVFYNYEFSQELNNPIMNWRSLHAGLTTDREKWISTNWFRSEDLQKQLAKARKGES